MQDVYNYRHDRIFLRIFNSHEMISFFALVVVEIVLI